MPNQTVIKEWVESLESGRYEQGQNRLRDGDQYCCLGVLCDMYAQKFGVKWSSDDENLDHFLGEWSALPREVQEWADLPTGDPDGIDGYRLSELNDGMSDGEGIKPQTFPEIAAIIREKYLRDH